MDEIQRIPSMLNTIQYLMDQDKSKRFFLTGSSARKFKRGSANLLPGRVLSLELGPLSLLELKKDFSVQKALTLGLLPGIYTESDEKIGAKLLQSYAATYIKEEIQSEALTKNLEGFSRFFSVVTSRSGDLLDFSKIASESSIERMSARRYYDILIDTLIAVEVPPFAKSRKKRMIQHPKFYFFDVGVLNGCLKNFSPSADRVGILFEHLVLQLILSAAKAKDEKIKVSTFCTEAGSEVDFIIENEQGLTAVEVKASKKVASHDLRGLKSFENFHSKKFRQLVIYLGDTSLKMDQVEVLPLQQALESMGYG